VRTGRTEAFDRDVLDLDTELTAGGEFGSGCLTATRVNDIQLILFEAPGKPGVSRILMFSFHDGGIDAATAQLANKRASMFKPRGWSCDLTDPDGHTFSDYQTDDKPQEADNLRPSPLPFGTTINVSGISTAAPAGTAIGCSSPR